MYGAQRIRTPKKYASYKITFNQKSWLYIGVDTTEKINDAIIKAFDNTGTYITTDKPEVFKVYKKMFDAQDTFSVDSGKNKIIVAAKPVFNLTPSYDLKKAIVYSTTNMRYTSGISTEKYNNKNTLRCASSNAEIITCPFATGVAGYYSLTLKYADLLSQNTSALIEIIDDKNTVLQHNNIMLKPSKTGKWNMSEIRTQSMINAGNYELRISFGQSPKSLYLESLQVK